jgi:hypothetical protein
VQLHSEAFIPDPRKARTWRLRRTVKEAARLLEANAEFDSMKLGRSAYRKTFITLTYQADGDWSPRHISEYVKRLRQWMQRKGHGCSYVWVAELQKRGALHYHMLVWVPRRLRLPRPDRCGWWPHGMSNIETARSPVGYMVKYASKTRPDDLLRLPKGVRLHGNGGLDPVSRVSMRERFAPAWFRAVDDQRYGEWLEAEEARRNEPLPPEGSQAWWDAYADELERRRVEEERWVAYAQQYAAKGFPKFRRVTGGYVDLVTGEFFETPWRVDIQHGMVMVYPKTETVQ